jgi:FkbM family methyltransferase
MKAGETEMDMAKLKRRHARNLRNAHAKGLLQGIVSMLQPGDIVCDCGANVGDVSEVLSASGATIHAFEPDPYCFEVLTKRFEARENIHLHNVAVGVSAGKVTLMRASNFDENPKGASVKSTILSGGRLIDDAPGKGIEVDLIDFPAFLRAQIAAHGAVAFVKLDIEGAELDLLDAMEQQGLFADIRLTVAETHEKKFEHLRSRFAALRDRIAAAYPITQVNLDWI